MLTDDQIEQLSKKMRFPLAGIYFKDELPRKLEYNKGYVINMEDSVDEDGNPNDGSHWVALQVNSKDGKVEPIYFDSYGKPPPESVKKFVMDNCARKLPYTTKDVQSLMNNACGWYCCAFLYFINTFEQRSRDLYSDVEYYLGFFDDLNHSIDYKKNEYILKHFFRSSDPTKRVPIEIDTDKIVRDDVGKGIDLTKIPVDVKYITNDK